MKFEKRPVLPLSARFGIISCRKNNLQLVWPQRMEIFWNEELHKISVLLFLSKLLLSVYINIQTFIVEDDEVPIPNEMSYPGYCNLTQNSMEYISTIPPPLFNFSADMFGDATLANYDSAVESE